MFLTRQIRQELEGRNLIILSVIILLDNDYMIFHSFFSQFYFLRSEKDRKFFDLEK